jgi:hypothetical protein
MATLVDSTRKQTDVFDFTESITGVRIIGFVAYRKRKKNSPVRLIRHRVFYFLRNFFLQKLIFKIFFSFFQCLFLPIFSFIIVAFRSSFDCGSDPLACTTELCLLGCFNDTIPNAEDEFRGMRDIASCSKW